MTLLLWLGASFVFGSLVEYVVHRLMHRGVFLAGRHRRHHLSNEAKGVLPELVDYLQGTAILLPWAFLVSVPAGIGWVAGGVAYGVWSAFGHQLQHDNPLACRWMRVPIHYVHHRDDLGSNFGLALSWWDHVFGTYRAVPWPPPEAASLPRAPWWTIGWTRPLHPAPSGAPASDGRAA